MRTSPAFLWIVTCWKSGLPTTSSARPGITYGEVQEASIASVAEAEEANQAGDAGPLRAARKADQDQNHPEEGEVSSRGGAECAHGIEPGDPEGHNVDANTYAGSSTVLSVTGHANRYHLRYAFSQ
jgi:hypothetical protein